MTYLTAEDVKSLEEEMKTYVTHAGRVNKILETVSGLYDFGGGNFVAPLPEVMDFNGKKHRVYIFTFEDGK